MAKGLGKKRGFKRSKTLERCKGSKKDVRKRQDEVAESPSSSSEDVYEEPQDSLASDDDEDVASLEEEELENLAQKEPSTLDTLIQKLKTDTSSLREAYKKRKRGDKKVDDSGENSDYNSESFDGSDEEDSSEAPASENYEEVLKDDENSDEDTYELSDSDEDQEIKDEDAKSVASTLQSTSSFNIHISSKLSKENIENLTKCKWKYEWEVPAFGMSSSKWMGTGQCCLKDENEGTISGLKVKLFKHWLHVYRTSGGQDFHSSKQALFFSLCNSYRDILHHNKKGFYQKGSNEDNCIMDAYLMHSLNHVFKTSNLVKKNDAKLGKRQETANEEVLTNDNFLDHGFTRPKVLILLPLASIALRVVKRLIQLTPPGNKANIEYRDRFYNEFGAETEENNDMIESPKKSSKPSDFDALFGANNNDHFMVGIKFTRKSLKLYSDFYSSDMIVASPLGVVTKIGDAAVNKEKDVDYLSSIEILVVDHADVIAMQNWSHVNTVVEHLNHLPSKQHGTDIMRIRQWYLDGHAKFYRQSIILSSYLNPDMNALFNHHCTNFEGKLKLSCEYKGVLPKVVLQVRQIYERFDADSLIEADDARFEYFVKKVFPKIKDSTQGGTMLFISSYFEFVRVRNFLKSQNASTCLVGEYTKQSDISRARVWFFEGKRKIMLYTERAHFYRRYKIRGIQNLIVYSLPERREFYPEVVNMLQEPGTMTCNVLFSRYDMLRLERIVGSAAAKRMVSSDKGIFVFC